MRKRYIVTGGCGFIGSAFVRKLSKQNNIDILIIDKLTYAGRIESLKNIGITSTDIFNGLYYEYKSDNPHIQLIKADICDKPIIKHIFNEFKPDTIIHFAAESHVDRSIDGPEEFVQTNVVGTVNLLSIALEYQRKVCPDFLFQHVSTDEVYGSLGKTGLFSENTRYDPHSPYSASKASADHFVKAWHDTYGLPVVITNCSNNYGPYQFPEKLIPLTILNCLYEKPIPVYGNGLNIRDWLYVDDHVDALLLVNEKGISGETYNIGGNCEQSNINIVKTICEIMDQLKPINKDRFINLLQYTTDRPGHDQRYAIDSSKIQKELGWTPKIKFKDGMLKTIQWYLDNEWWWKPIRISQYSGERLGL
jgi:dTDP-glucose 4,6-dehydratase